MINGNGRITELEVKVAYQEDTIETLNQEIIRQQKEIDAFKRHLLRVNAQIEQLASNENDVDVITHEVPPHY